MSIHFYAGYWQFGVGVTNFEGEPYCSLLSFDSRKERDAWVAADHFDNNWHRSAGINVEVHAAFLVYHGNVYAFILDNHDRTVLGFVLVNVSKRLEIREVGGRLAITCKYEFLRT